MKNGIIRHYIPEKGFGFLTFDDGLAVNESKMMYFHITCCDIQTPPPRIGERVLFVHNHHPIRPETTALTRPELKPELAKDAIGESHEHVRQPASVSTRQPAHNTIQEPAVITTRESTGVTIREPRSSENRTTNVHRPTRDSVPPERASGDDEPEVDDARQITHKQIHKRRQQLIDAPSCFEGGSLPRYVYVDLDNVWVSFVNANHLVELFPGAVTTRDLELNLEGFTRRLAESEEGGRVVRLVAFYFNTPEPIAARLRTMSFEGVPWEVRKQETTSDTSMQLELLTSKRPCAAHPKTLVLVTGDGNIAPNGMCFREILDLYLRDGWSVEVHAWLATMASSYIEYQREYASVAVIRPFDDDNVGEIIRLRPRGGGGAPPQRTRTPPRQAAVENRRADHGRSSRPTAVNLQKRNTAPETGRNEVRSSAPTRVPAMPRATATAAAPVREKLPNDEWTAPPVRAAAMPQAPPSAASPRKEPTAWRPEQFARIISELEGPDGELYVPSGINFLIRSGSAIDTAMLYDLDPETQRLLLVSALNDEMDAATRRVLLTEEPGF